MPSASDHPQRTALATVPGAVGNADLHSSTWRCKGAGTSCGAPRTRFPRCLVKCGRTPVQGPERPREVYSGDELLTDYYRRKRRRTSTSFRAAGDGEVVFRIEFDNDAFDAEKSQDRNAFVRDAGSQLIRSLLVVRFGNRLFYVGCHSVFATTSFLVYLKLRTEAVGRKHLLVVDVVGVVEFALQVAEGELHGWVYRRAVRSYRCDRLHRFWPVQRFQVREVPCSTVLRLM
jgi:hypothetical protein